MPPVRKPEAARAAAAYAKITLGVLLEPGTHSPLAAALGWPDQSAWQLACGLLAAEPKDSLNIMRPASSKLNTKAD